MSSSVCQAHVLLRVEANAEVNGIGKISNPFPSQTLGPIWMRFKYVTTSAHGVDVRNLIKVNAVAALCMLEKNAFGVVFGRSFVKRFALCYQTVVCPVRSCLSVCPVCNAGVLWPNGWMDQDVTWHAGRPRPWPHCIIDGDPASPPSKGHSRPPPHLRTISVVAKWLDGSRCHLVGK